MAIERTVIGSFPRWAESLDQALADVVQVQLQYGIDVITDGEQRGGMIAYFEQIPGLERTGDKLKIAGKIEPMDEVEAFYKLQDYRTVKGLLDRQGKLDVKVKMTLTGPITLGISCLSTDVGSARKHYNLNDREALYADCAAALAPIATRALGLGAYVQFDEPGYGFTSPELAKDVLNDLVSRLPSSAIDEEKVSIHVCGSIRGATLYDSLLALEIPILSLAFSGQEERGNIDIISQPSLEDHNKRVGVGFISNVEIEEERVAVERLTRIAHKVGVENIAYLHPDCGFRSTDPDKVRTILHTMNKASSAFTQSMKG